MSEFRFSNALDEVQHFFDFIECKTSLFKLVTHGVPWYMFAKELVTYTQARTESKNISSETSELRERVAELKFSLLESPLDAVLITKAKMRGLDQGQRENIYFYEIQKKLEESGKRYVVLEQASGDDLCDLKFLESSESEKVIPYEPLVNPHLSANRDRLKPLAESVFHEIDNLLKENSHVFVPEEFREPLRWLIENYRSLCTYFLKDYMLVNDILESTGARVVFGGMGTHLFPGLRENLKSVHVEHGCIAKFQCICAPHFPVKTFWDESLPLKNLFSLANSSSDTLWDNEVIVPEENRYKYGLPLFRFYEFSDERVRQLKEKYSPDKKIILVLTNGRLITEDFIPVFKALTEKFSDLTFLLRPHPGYDNSGDYQSVSGSYQDVRHENLYDLFQVADVIFSVPSSCVLEAMQFTENILVMTDNRFKNSNRLLITNHYWDKIKVADLFCVEEILYEIEQMLKQDRRVELYKMQASAKPELDELFERLF